MQVQTISNSQPNQTNFQGRIAIVNELSAEPCRRIRNIIPDLEKVINDKPFDLFVTETHQGQSLSFIAQKSKHFGKKNKPISEYSVATNISYPNTEKDIEKFYIAVATDTVSDFEKMLPKKASFADKCKNILNKFCNHFINAITDRI